MIKDDERGGAGPARLDAMQNPHRAGLLSQVDSDDLDVEQFAEVAGCLFEPVCSGLVRAGVAVHVDGANTAAVDAPQLACEGNAVAASPEHGQ